VKVKAEKSGADCSGPAKATQTTERREIMCPKQRKSLSELMQEMDGSISGNLRAEIVKLGELLGEIAPRFPNDEAYLEGRRRVLALSEICGRVHALERAALIGPQDAGGTA